MTTRGSPTTTSPTPPATSSASSTTRASARIRTPTAPPASAHDADRGRPPAVPLRPARTPTRPACTRWATATTTPPWAASPSPTRSGQETNPYLYAAGDPINKTDPNGLLGCPGWLEDACRTVGDGLNKAEEVTAKSAIGLALLARSFREDNPGCRNAIYTGAAGLTGMMATPYSGGAAVFAAGGGWFTYQAGLEGAKDSC